MASVKAVIRTKQNSQNLFPIAIRITKDRKTSFLYTGQYIKKNQWDKTKGQVKKSHPDALNINQLIFKKLSKVNRSLMDAETNSEYMCSKHVKSSVTSKKANDFFEIAKIYLKNIEDRKKFHQLDIEIRRIEVFREFLKKDKLFFDELHIELLKKFENYLLNERSLSKRTVVNYMTTIRTIFNLAITNSSVDVTLYPFGRGKYQIKFPETKKIGLNSDEITILENIEGLTKAQEYALHVWLLSFYFAGIRVSDVLQLKWKDFLDNRLYYRMDKNNKLLSLKVPGKVFNILNKLERRDSSVFLFKELEGVDLDNKRLLRTRIKTATRNFNRRLEIVATKAGIDKKMSMHIARHSFGNISGDKIPIQMLQKLYRHSSVTTTIQYQSNFMQKDTDEALDKVLDF
ncbi:MAG: site-specific integrase [Algibacter sp.]|uniref:site-specific integrase n=1 Tax=Algibacter sp. TaxID=1872428 RepID=UPI002607F294|nr:site-specific integrase [Algibacter sp.]MDG1728238.1 site-specific integrase [Algibacter sp.]MDG2180005.1 site-specific integrase [Algibacter sp.]